MTATRLVKQISLNEYHELLEKYHIEVNPHAYFRIDEAQRKVYNDEYLKDVLTKETPVFIGIQQNGRHAAFFKRKTGYLRIIFEVEPTKIEIGTFYLVDHIPWKKN